MLSMTSTLVCSPEALSIWINSTFSILWKASPKVAVLGWASSSVAAGVKTNWRTTEGFLSESFLKARTVKSKGVSYDSFGRACKN